MGQTLSEPVTLKVSDKAENSRLKVGVSSTQGWRVSMEDAHSHILSLPGDPEASYFGVFDGHGGSKIAHYSSTYLHIRIMEQPEYAEGDIPGAMKKGFLLLDKEMYNDESLRKEMSGSTAIIAFMKDGSIYCGNVGDSRCVLSVGGVAHALSSDHKPTNPEEESRICAAGGWVDANRVNGNLALSRALGDFFFKGNDTLSSEKQIVTACPDVVVEMLSPGAEFFILACDGIWDVMTNKEVVDFCRCRIAQCMAPHIICEELLSQCLAPDCMMGGLGCDNMTAVLVCLLRDGSYENLAAKCSESIADSFPLSSLESPTVDLNITQLSSTSGSRLLGNNRDTSIYEKSTSPIV